MSVALPKDPACHLDPGLCYPSTWQPASPDPWQTWSPVHPVVGTLSAFPLVAAAVTFAAFRLCSWLARPVGLHE